MVVRAVSVIFLSVYLMAGNHLTVSAANGEKISEDSDFSVSGENMDSLLNSLDLSRIEAFLREAGGSAVPGLSFREILSMLLSGNYQSVVRMLMDFCRTALFREISENGRWMGQVILLGILGAVFASFSSLFADSQVSEMGFYVTYLLIFTLLAASFLNGVRITRTLLEQLFEFVRVLVPAFFLAVSFSGGSTSAAAGYAWTLASVNVAEWVFLRLFLPCTQLYVLLSLAGHLSSKDLFSKALELLEQGMRWGSKALLGVVLGFHVLQGMIAPYTDSVRQTALRRAVSLIPGIGQGAAAVSQVLLGSSVLIRNTVGIGGVLVLAAVSLLPLLKLLILYLGCQGSAALLQPVSDSRVVEAVGAVAKGFYFLLAAAGSALVLFALSIAVVEVITHWAGNIVSYLVFLTVLTGLLPAHKYEKYIRLFAGCILLLIVLKPLTDGLRLEERLNYLFTSLSFENEAGELKREMDEIEVRRRNMVLSQYEAEASKEAVRVAAEAGFSVEKADVELEKDPESEQFASVRSVTVYVAGSEAGMEAAELEENQSSMIEIEKISPIEISLEQEQKQGEPAAAQAVSWMNGEKIWELQQRLASFYQVEADHVEVRMEP